jgi:Ser/Thr protein kinase RdoA (MazF antagonist)
MADMKLLPLECLADAGRLLGKIDKSLDLLTPHKLRQDQQQQHDELNLDESLLTAARRFHQWDGKNTAELRSFTHCVTDDKRRRLVESVIDAFSSTLLETGVAKEFRKGINHGDFNDANVLLDGDFQVTGVIDFGDSVERYVVGQYRSLLDHTAHPTRVSGLLTWNRPIDKTIVGGFCRICHVGDSNFEELY